MSESASKGQDYESSLSGASQSVAQFEDTRKGLVHKIQHALHVTPSLVRLIVLLLSIVAVQNVKDAQRPRSVA